MAISVRVEADSIAPCGTRLTTIVARYPRYIHGEVMTYREFSRNASSSRAVPIKRLLKEVWNDPVIPVHWGRDRKGMVATGELGSIRKVLVRAGWRALRTVAVVVVWSLSKVGLHKQVANRLLEPWAHISVIITSTQWAHFLKQRTAPDAQPEIRELAEKILKALNESIPRRLNAGEWHLPFVTLADRTDRKNSLADLKIVSVARCARVSYLNHEGKRSQFHEDLALYERLAAAPHASPFEHQAVVTGEEVPIRSNFRGNWNQLRKIELENEYTARFDRLQVKVW